MKKIFTLLATVMVAISVNAQTWSVSDAVAEAGTIDANTTLVDNDLATVKTVYAAKASVNKNADNEPTAITFGSYSLLNWFQLRNDSYPSATDPVGKEKADCSPLVVTAKKTTDISLFIRRGATKTINCFEHSTAAGIDLKETGSVVDGDNVFCTATFTLKAGESYTIYTKGGTTRVFGFDLAAGEVAKVTKAFYDGKAKDVNEITYGDGAVLKLNVDGKTYGNGKPVTLDGNTYTTIKLSNGAENVLTLPETAYAIRLYSYINKKTADAEGTDSFWKLVGGAEYTAEDGTMKDCLDTPDYLTNLDVFTYSLGEGTNIISFTNKGQQVFFVAEVFYDKDEAAALDNITAIEGVAADGKIVLNDKIFNLAGQQVSKDYKGVVIKNGKKMIQK